MRQLSEPTWQEQSDCHALELDYGSAYVDVVHRCRRAIVVIHVRTGETDGRAFGRVIPTTHAHPSYAHCDAERALADLIRDAYRATR